MLYTFLIMLLAAVVDARSVDVYSNLPPPRSSSPPHSQPAYHSLPPHTSSRFGAPNHCTFTRSHPLSHLPGTSSPSSSSPDTFHNPPSSRPQRLLHPQRRPQPRLRILSQLSSELDEESRIIPVNAWVHIAQLLEGVVLEGKLGMRTFRLGSEVRELEFEGVVLGVTVKEVPAVVASSHDHHLSGGEDKEELKKRDSDGVAGGELSKPVEAREPPKPVSEKETESEIVEATRFAREERECVFRAAQEVEIKRQMEGWMDLKAPKGEAKLRVSFLVYRVD